LRKNWTSRWIGEFIVIVLGVLVALGVDDIRQYLAERDLEAYLLERLAEDLRADAADLALARLGFERQRWLLTALSVDLEQGVAEATREPPPDSLVNPAKVNTLLQVAGRNAARAWTPLEDPLETFRLGSEFDLADDAFQELLAEGALQTVRDRDLRAQVLAYYRTAEDMRENGRQRVTYLENLEDAWSRVGVVVGDSLTVAELLERLRLDPTLIVDLRRCLRDLDWQLFFLNPIEGERLSLQAALELGDQAAI
jgi:hypothetical protein